MKRGEEVRNRGGRLPGAWSTGVCPIADDLTVRSWPCVLARLRVIAWREDKGTRSHCLARRQGLRSQEMPAARGCPPRRRKATPPARCKRHAPARGTSVATFPGHAMCALAPWLGCLPSGPSVLDLVRGLSWLARPPTTGPSSLGHMSSFDHTPLLGRVRLRLGLVAHPRDRAPSVCRRSQHALGCRHDPARPAECARS